jgi:hypothetical protein
MLYAYKLTGYITVVFANMGRLKYINALIKLHSCFVLLKNAVYADYTYPNKGVLFNVMLDSASLELDCCSYECG